MQETTDLRRSKPTDSENLEKAGYLDVSGNQLYYVFHPTIIASAPKGKILFIGPFVSERPHRYIQIVRLARFLALNGYDFLRFDYRGCGESTGQFENFGFNSWKDDAIECYNMLQQQTGRTPIILYGLGMGALIAEKLFLEGFGNALLLGLPPASGHELLFDQLRLRLANDFILRLPNKKTREGYVADLEDGKNVEVEGYLWTQKLWNEAGEYILKTKADGNASSQKMDRPSVIQELDSYSAHMFGGVGPNPLRHSGGGRQMHFVNPDLSSIFSDVVSIFDGWIKQIDQ